MNAFETLGHSLEDSWRQANYDEAQFPAIAAAALTRARIPDSITGNDVLRWLLLAPQLPEQEDPAASFGEPPITVFRGRRFYVQVIFWLHGSTSIHQHGFAGAFQVLEGSSLHSRYAFELQRRISSRFLLGAVRLRDAGLLRRGEVVEITHDLAHCLFHLEAPSATIVVRSYGESEAGPQYEFLPPHLAFDPFFEDPWTSRRLQGLALLARSGNPEHDKLAVELLETSDLQTGYLVLEQSLREVRDHTRSAHLKATFRRLHPETAPHLEAVLEESRRRRWLHQLRAGVTNPEQRFFLALLQNLPTQDAIAALLAKFNPSRTPLDLIREFALALSGTERIGVDLEDDLNRSIFEALVDSGEESSVFERLNVKYGRDAVDAQADELHKHIARIRRSALSPLFVKSE